LTAAKRQRTGDAVPLSAARHQRGASSRPLNLSRNSKWGKYPRTSGLRPAISLRVWSNQRNSCSASPSVGMPAWTCDTERQLGRDPRSRLLPFDPHSTPGTLLTTNVLREFVPLIAVVRAKRRRWVIAPLGPHPALLESRIAMRLLSGDSKSDDFFFDLPPN
jgi:hypothetical protein